MLCTYAIEYFSKSGPNAKANYIIDKFSFRTKGKIHSRIRNHAHQIDVSADDMRSQFGNAP